MDQCKSNRIRTLMTLRKVFDPQLHKDDMIASTKDDLSRGTIIIKDVRLFVI